VLTVGGILFEEPQENIFEDCFFGNLPSLRWWISHF
jgi:hypothetical protein